MKQLFSFLTLAALSVLIICCSDDGVSTNNSQPISKITITDSLGNILGGDTTQWCRKGYCNNVNPCFPNPVKNKFTIPFDIRISNDTLSLFIVNGNDTISLFKNKPFAAGTYRYVFWADSLNLHNATLRAYFVGKKPCPITPPNCSDGGYIQFY